MIKPSYYDAVSALVGNENLCGGYSNGPLDQIVFVEGFTDLPTEAEIQSKLTELLNVYPMQLLREERNRKLAETDWWCCSDRTPTQAQLEFRTALRNLPSTASPSLDENGELTGVNWPEKPQN